MPINVLKTSDKKSRKWHLIFTRHRTLTNSSDHFRATRLYVQGEPSFSDETAWSSMTWPHLHGSPRVCHPRHHSLSFVILVLSTPTQLSVRGQGCLQTSSVKAEWHFTFRLVFRDGSGAWRELSGFYYLLPAKVRTVPGKLVSCSH